MKRIVCSALLTACMLVNLCVPAFAAALAVVAVTPDKTSAIPGASITWTIEAEGGTGGYTYYFTIYKDGARVAGTSKYGAASTYTYTPTEAGSYTARGYAKDADGVKANRLSAATTVASTLAVKSVAANKATAAVGEAITWTIEAEGGAGGYTYYFTIYKDDVRVAGSSKYGAASTYTYTPTEAGSYTARGFVRDAAAKKADKFSTATLVGAQALVVKSVTGDKATAQTGEAITWTIEAEGGAGGYTYYFYIYKDGVLMERSATYAADNTFAYTPAEAGSYTARGFVKDARNTRVNKDSAPTVVSACALAIARIEADKATAKAGEEITWTIEAEGGAGGYLYYFYIYQDGALAERSAAYGADNTYTYKSMDAGNYTVRGYVKDANNTRVYKDSEPTVVTLDELSIESLLSSTISAPAGTPIVWTATATGGVGKLRYWFYVYLNGTVVASTNDYMEANTFTLNDTQVGQYTASVYVHDEAATTASLNSANVTTITEAGELAVQSVTVSATRAMPGDTLTWTALASGGTGAHLYYFMVYKDGAVVARSTTYAAENTFAWQATEPGTYYARAYAKDATGLKVSAKSEITTVVDRKVSGDFEYAVVDGEMWILAYTGSASQVVVPATLDDMNVLAIGPSAFEGNTTLEKITLPSTITRICQRAFAGCTALSQMDSN